MTRVLHISEAASLAIHTMALLAVEPDKIRSTREIADVMQVSETHLAKVLQRLSKVDLVKSIRGPGGGFLIGKSPSETTLLEIFESIDGPVRIEDCVLQGSDCARDVCIFGDLLNSIGHQIRDYLSQTTLDKIARWRWK